jgi:tetratricopeptide (TPR) repeat protein
MSYEEALAAFRRGQNGEAARLAAEDVAAARASGDVQAWVDGLCMLARVALREGDFVEVAARAEEAHRLADDSGSERLKRMPLHLRAVAARMSGRYEEGRDLYLRSIAVNDALGEAAMAAAEHRNLAYLEIRAGNHDRARELFAQSAARFARVHAPTMAPYLTFDRATVAALDGDHATATALLAAAQRQWDEQGVVPDPDDAAEIAGLERRLAEWPARLLRHSGRAGGGASSASGSA